MAENVTENHEHEMITPGMAFMGFLMGAVSILGIWFLSTLLQVISHMIG